MSAPWISPAFVFTLAASESMSQPQELDARTSDPNLRGCKSVSTDALA